MLISTFNSIDQHIIFCIWQKSPDVLSNANKYQIQIIPCKMDKINSVDIKKKRATILSFNHLRQIYQTSQIFWKYIQNVSTNIMFNSKTLINYGIFSGTSNLSEISTAMHWAFLPANWSLNDQWRRNGVRFQN